MADGCKVSSLTITGCGTRHLSSSEMFIVGLLAALLTLEDGLRKGGGSSRVDVTVGSLICTITIEGSSRLITLTLTLASTEV